MNYRLVESFKKISNKIEEELDIILPKNNNIEYNNLIEAMRYSVLSPGKRLRPFLVISSASLFNINQGSAIQVALAIELIHTYSLIHDDLPSIDNDDIRRGQASCHIKFGESTALLAGNALLTLAFEILANRKTNAAGSIRCELIVQFAKAIGVGGMISGQILDLLYKNDEYNINDIIRTQRMKTGALFAVACESGAIIAKAPKNIHIALKGYAHAIGIAYQIIDDIADHDDSKKQSSFVSIMGIDKAFDQASKLIDQALIHLNIFDNRADNLREFARYIIR